MTNFYVSYMKPIGRARIHKGSCSHCNDGKGQKGQDKEHSGITGWDGPMTLEEAKEKLEYWRKTRNFKDLAFCGTCLRSHVI